MAGVRAAVERRKASALRSARAPSGALPPLIFLEAKAWWLWSAKLGCGCIARTRSHSSPLAGEDRSRAARSGEGPGIPALPKALTRRAASRHATLSRKGRGLQRAAREQKNEETA